MRVSKTASILAFAAILLGVFLAPLGAAENYTVETYNETYAPGEKTDGILTVQLKAAPGADGYVYLVKTIAKMTPRGNLEGAQNASGSLESYKQGDMDFFRVKASNPDASVSLTARFDCPGFYGAKPKAGDTGAPSIPVNCKFTNPFNTTVGSYNVKVILPEGEEVIAVTTPRAYADFVLGKDGDTRSVSISKKKLTPTSAVTLTFSFGKTLANSALGVILLWLACLAVGGAVLIARLPRKKPEAA
jgi:hypothetical protein